MLIDLMDRHHRWVVIEEGARMGGAASAVMEWLHERASSCEVLSVGLPDGFVHQGEPSEVLADLGLSASGIESSIRTRWPLTPFEQGAGLRRVV